MISDVFKPKVIKPNDINKLITAAIRSNSANVVRLSKTITRIRSNDGRIGHYYVDTKNNKIAHIAELNASTAIAEFVKAFCND